MSEHELWNELGNLYFMSGTYKQAAYAYNRSIQLDAGFGRPYCNLALTYVKEGRYEEAVRLYQRSIELLLDQTEKAITWYRLGDVYRHLKNYRDAIMAYQQADVLGPELSQECKESNEILYGGSGENIQADAPEMQARALETEAAVQAAEEQAETAPEAASVTGTLFIEPSPVMASVTSTLSIHEPTPAAAVTETETVGPESEASEPISETLAILELPEAEPELLDEDPETLVTPEPAVDLVEDAVGDPVSVEDGSSIESPILEAEPIAETSMVLECVETAPEPGFPDFGITQPVEALDEAALVEAGQQPDLKIEIVLDREEPAPLQAETLDVPAEDIEAVMEERAETVSMPEIPEAVAETFSMSEEPAPAVQTLSNAADPEPGWVDDDYLVSNFEHETEVFLPDFEDDAIWIPLPLEPEPAHIQGQPENSWSPENRMQLPVQAPVDNTRRLPGQMLRESWEPALPLAEAELELPFPEEGVETSFIMPQETADPEMTVEAGAPLSLECRPEPLQTAEELEQIEKEITRFKYVVQSNPRNAAAWDALGTFYKAARKYREAILAYQQAVAVDQSKACYHHRLGIMYSIQGREEDAIKAFQDVIEIEPEHCLANATLGGYYRKMGLEELAQKHIGRAMKNFYNSENEYNRACLEALCGNIEQSIELLKIALKNKQTYVDWVLRDPDLDSIRRDPRFKQLISDYLG